MRSKQGKPPWRQLDIDDAQRSNKQEASAAFSGRLNELRARLNSIDPALLSLGEHRWYTVREAVMTIASHDDRGRRRCEKSAKFLAGELLMTVGQWYEALRHAKRLGLVRASQRYINGERHDDAHQIDERALDQLLELARTRSNQLELGRTSYEAGPNQVPSSSDVGRTTYKELLLNLTSPSSSPPSPDNETQIAAGDPRWGEVEEELLKCGLKAFRKAARAAAKANADPADVLAIVAWWRPRREAWGHYGLQNLFWRVHHCRAGDRERPGEGWPAADPGWRDPTKRVEADQRWRAELAGSGAEAAASTAVAIDLEAQHGARLDALSNAEAIALVAGNGHWIAQLKKHGRTGHVRVELLNRLESTGGEL